MTALAVCRFAHILAAMLVFGASAAMRLDAPENLRRALTPTVRTLATSGSLIALAAAGLWLALQAAAFAGDPGAATDPAAIAAVLTDTDFGRVWVWRIGLAAAICAASMFAPRENWTAVAAVSGLLLASLGLVGHAAMQTGVMGALHRASAALHDLAAGAWIGGLVVFVLCLDASAQAPLRREAIAAMTRFSVRGHVVVAALVATGIANVWLTAGRAPLPPSTPWRALLDVKIGLVAIMIGIALCNRYGLAPRVRSSAAALPRLRALSLVNVGLGTVVVALVAVFALLDPA